MTEAAALKAGPEMDTLIRDCVFNGKDAPASWISLNTYYVEPPQSYRPYSSTIECAWLVVEKMKRHVGIGEWIAIEVTRGDLVRVGIADHNTHSPGGSWRYLQTANTVPLAVCRFALAALAAEREGA